MHRLVPGQQSSHNCTNQPTYSKQSKLIEFTIHSGWGLLKLLSFIHRIMSSKGLQGQYHAIVASIKNIKSQYHLRIWIEPVIIWWERPWHDISSKLNEILFVCCKTKLTDLVFIGAYRSEIRQASSQSFLKIYPLSSKLRENLLVRHLFA